MNESLHPTPSRPRWRLAAIALAAAMLAAACSSDSADDATTTTEVETTQTTESSPSMTEAAAEAEPQDTVAPEPIEETTTGNELAEALDALEARGFDGVVSVRQGADITTRAFGEADREAGTPNDAETVFDIGSISKQFTAAAILRLEMDGLLSVEDTIGDHVDGLPDELSGITLHELLTHTGGFAVGYGADDDPIGSDAFLELAGIVPLNAEPGERFEYSNVGYTLAGIVVEEASGQSYESYLRSAIFEPAGMFDTGYLLPDWDDHTIAVGYIDPEGERFGRPAEQNWADDGPGWHLRANGGLLSTAADMLRWDVALHGDEVLDAEAKAKFFAPHIEQTDFGVPYGYGWIVVPRTTGDPLIFHGGSNGVFYAELLRVPDADVGVFIVTNSSVDADADVAFALAEAVLGDLAIDPAVDSVDEQPIESAVVDVCGFDRLSVDTFPEYPEIAALPDTPAGSTAAMLLDLLAESDTASRLAFVADHVTSDLVAGNPAGLAATIEILGAEFTDVEVLTILQESDTRFHLPVEGPFGEVFVFSLGFDETDPERLACLGIAD